MKRFISIILLLTVVTVAFSQNKYTISGTLADSLNHEKIFYATIGLLTSDSNARVIDNTFSDVKGQFSFTEVPAGTYNLKFSLVGYDLLTMPVRVGGDQKRVDLGEVLMKKISNTLSEVSIKTERPVYMMDGEKTLYNVSDDPTIQSGTAADALQNSPGVEVDVEGNITLRGVSSVEIWLNGKPSNMNEEALKQFIQQMPAGSIDKIEVITNPSARYSAKGNGGIINIVTSSKIKKNSFVSFGVRGSSTPDITPFLSYVYANEKFSISAYANYSYNVSKGNSSSHSVFFNDAGDTSSVHSEESSYRYNNHRPGLFLHGSYTPDTVNSFYFWGGTYPSVSKSNSFSSVERYEYIDNPGDYSYDSESFNPTAPSGGGYAGMWFEHKFNNKGHNISVDLSYSGWKSNSTSSYNRDYTVMDYLDKYKNMRYKYSNNSINSSIDYTIPYHENGEIELGVSGYYNHSKNFLEQDTLVLGTTDVFQIDSLRSFDCLDQNSGGDAYVTIQHRFGNFTIKGGLRMEYENYNLRYAGLPQHDLSKNYLGFFPSLHLSYRTKSMHNFKLSYSRRVDNPSSNDLSTFINYDEDSYSTGNPDLRQAFTNSVEAGWTKFIPKFGNIGISAYFRNTKDDYNDITDVIFDPFFGRIISFSRPINSGKTLNTGAELNVTYQLKAFMNIRFYANMHYDKSSFQFRDSEEPHSVENLGYSFRLNFWAKLWKVLEVNASANYRSKSVNLFTTTLPNYSIDCGLRAEFWKRRISVHLDVHDIFNWNKTSTDVNNPYYVVSSTSRNSWFGRSIRAGITFKFGKMELESQAQQGQGGGGSPMGM